jgi:hypothetical protein
MRVLVALSVIKEAQEALCIVFIAPTFLLILLVELSIH